ncbi:hypothetical protein ATN88_22330 [Enterovibrio coralii]|uniref:DUF3047 domain-containing protein n=2 Tax=Enterovibrio coralii TaxID=294935 RepID=A0A135I4W2_9GAMM|nr:hypothetical protein ATN88_22330 [Enterovibrio coralii]
MLVVSVGLIAYPALGDESAALQGTIFPYSPLDAWKEQTFIGATAYQPTFDKAKGEGRLLTESEGSASALYREVDITLDETPLLSWGWEIKRFPTVESIKTKKNDDYALRVSVTARTGFTMMSSQTIVYVWSPHDNVDASWPSPFSPKKFKLINVSSGDATGEWREVKRNVKQDFQRVFGLDIKKVSAIAIMSDSDNSNSRASGVISPLVFSERSSGKDK